MVLITRFTVRLIGVTFLLLASGAPAAQAEILFEGYAKVTLGGVHVGYVVQRYEFDSKKQEFASSYYLRTNTLGGSVTESLKARSTATLKPIAYQYTELIGDKAKSIDASFKGDNMTAVVRQGGAQQTVTRKIPKGAFLSNFLVYLMLQGKEGIKPGTKYSYNAIAEEEAGIHPGEAFVESQETVAGAPAFKVLNTFKGVRFASYVNSKGEILATKSPVQGIATELVANMQEAIGSHAFNASNVKLLFGSVPQGKENSIAKSRSQSPSPVPSSTAGGAVTPPAAGANSVTPGPSGDNISPGKKDMFRTPPPSSEDGKKQGVPGGQGLILKGDDKKPNE